MIGCLRRMNRLSARKKPAGVPEGISNGTRYTGHYLRSLIGDSGLSVPGAGRIEPYLSSLTALVHVNFCIHRSGKNMIPTTQNFSGDEIYRALSRNGVRPGSPLDADMRARAYSIWGSGSGVGP